MLGLLGANRPTLAGECTEGTEEYVSRLERWAEIRPLDRIASSQVNEACGCLASKRYVFWAGPIAARHFRNLHESPFRPRIAAAAARYLDLPGPSGPYDPDLALDAANTLALYGVRQADGYDVLEVLLRRCSAAKRPLPYFALASIGDRRVLSLLRAAYDSLLAMPRSDRVHEDKVELVSCLYHLPGDSALALVQAIAAGDADSVVCARAKHVISARKR